VFTLVGISLVIVRLIPTYVADEIILGVMLIAAGVGLLLYYFIASAMKMAHERNHKSGNNI